MLCKCLILTVLFALQTLLQTVQSHDGSIRSVVEKGDALLASVHYPSVRDKMNRLQKDYTDLCNMAMVCKKNRNQVKYKIFQLDSSSGSRALIAVLSLRLT